MIKNLDKIKKIYPFIEYDIAKMKSVQLIIQLHINRMNKRNKNVN